MNNTIKEFIDKIKNDEVTYREVIDADNLWEEIHSIINDTTQKPPFYKSFDQYSMEWFNEVKEDFVVWLEYLYELSNKNAPLFDFLQTKINQTQQELDNIEVQFKGSEDCFNRHVGYLSGYLQATQDIFKKVNLNN